MAESDQRDPETACLHANAKTARLQAIQSQLALGCTLCELAETEIRIGDVAIAQRLVGKVRHSAETIRFHLDEPEHVPETNVDLRGDLSRLENRLNRLEAQLAQPKSTPAKRVAHL